MRCRYAQQLRRAPKIVDFAGCLGPDVPELKHANLGRQPFVVSLLCLRNRLAPGLLEPVAPCAWADVSPSVSEELARVVKSFIAKGIRGS